MADVPNTVRLRHVDLSDGGHPEHSGRYVYLPDLLRAVHVVRAADDPRAELERLLLEVSAA